MIDHLGDTNQDILELMESYVPFHFDEYLRPTLHVRHINERENYRSENPWYASGYFYSLLTLLNRYNSNRFKDFAQREIFPRCEGRRFGTLSRQPEGKNYYPVDHPEYEKSIWNRISKDECVGAYLLADKEWREKFRSMAEANTPFDDFGVNDVRYRHSLTSRYYYIKGQHGKPNLTMKSAWQLDKTYDYLQIKIIRHFARQKSIADTINKDFMRAVAGVGKMPSKKLRIWAADTYFEDSHPFKILVRA